MKSSVYSPHPNMLHHFREGVVNLKKDFLDFEFDAHCGALSTEEEYNSYLNSVNLYKKAAAICEQFLEDSDITNFVTSLRASNLERYLKNLKNYVRAEDLIDILDIETVLYIYSKEEIVCDCSECEEK